MQGPFGSLNYADSESVDAHFTGSIGAVREIKVFGFWGEYGRKAET
ncbi:uncharacterized protein UBRO2_06041 [Ustilago bromivora]|uniref:Uncharacterized protein n=1 Tax=Ustilago bromivora TaxID=307758 RepID=A0A8H8TVM4_9BASI|nr:uncharacterized protein UBRO2_06041 [Ustilago bromivora]